MSCRDRPSQDVIDRLPRWDALAGVRLVMAVRNAGGMIPRALEPPNLLLDILASRNERIPQEEASERIFAAMPEPQWRQFQQAHVALSELADAVGLAVSAADAVDDLTKDSTWRTRARALDEILGQLRRARARWDDPRLLDELERYFEPSPQGPMDVLDVLDRLLQAVQSARGDLPDCAPATRGKITRQSALVQGLARVYQQEFGFPAGAGVTHSWEVYRGPFVAFVRTAYQIAGRPVPSDGALTKALQRYMPQSLPPR